MSRNFKLGILLAALVVALIELQSWAFLSLAARLNAFRIYSDDVFARMSDDELTRAAGHGPLGWPVADSPRSAPPGNRICGAAFGDSMTYGAEVEDNEAWVHLLSLRLGCTIANHAVPAYGADQTLLRYERIASEGQFVILGLYLEMIRRSVAASWTFYSPMHPMRVYQIKPYFALDGAHLRLQPIPEPLTRETAMAHHGGDYYMRHVATAMHFPYTLTAARAIHIKFMRTGDYRRAEKFLDPAHPSGSGVLIRRLIDRFAEIARQRNVRLVVVLVPTAKHLMTDTAWEVAFANELRRRGDSCVIDVKPSLREHARPLGGRAPTMPRGHYTATGNRWIAEAVAAGLDNCNLGLLAP